MSLASFNLWYTWCERPAYRMLMRTIGHDGYDDSVGQDIAGVVVGWSQAPANMVWAVIQYVISQTS